MRPSERIWDPLAVVDAAELFREYLDRNCADEELVQWVMRQMEDDNVGLTDSVRAILEEAVGYLSRGELIEQIMLNEQDRRRYPGYRRWCIRALEARREREVREGAVYR